MPDERGGLGVDITHEAEAFVTQLWADIYSRVRSLMHPHHIEHERGGKDQVALELEDLANVDMAGKVDGNVPVWNASDELWKPSAGGAITGAAASLRFAFGIVGPVGSMTGYELMRNVCGTALSYSEVYMAWTGTLTASASIGTTSYSGSQSGLTGTLADNGIITLTLSGTGSGTTAPADFLLVTG